MITGPSFMTTVYPPTVSRSKEKKNPFSLLDRASTVLLSTLQTDQIIAHPKC